MLFAINQQDLEISYDAKARFTSYWYQIHETVRSIGSTGTVLEVGPGNRFFTDYLLKHGFAVETLDIKEVTAPDHVGSVTEIPLPDRSFDAVVCFQVLEHMPFKLFSKALKDMARVARKQVLFSVPDVRFYFEINLILSFSKKRHRHKTLTVPWIRNHSKMPHFHA